MTFGACLCCSPPIETPPVTIATTSVVGTKAGGIILGSAASTYVGTGMALVDGLSCGFSPRASFSNSSLVDLVEDPSSLKPTESALVSPGGFANVFIVAFSFTFSVVRFVDVGIVAGKVVFDKVAVVDVDAVVGAGGPITIELIWAFIFSTRFVGVGVVFIAVVTGGSDTAVVVNDVVVVASFPNNNVESLSVCFC